MNYENVIKMIVGILLIGLGVKIIIVKKFVGRGGYFDFTSPLLHWPIGSLFIVLGGVLLYSLIHLNSKN